MKRHEQRGERVGLARASKRAEGPPGIHDVSPIGAAVIVQFKIDRRRSAVVRLQGSLCSSPGSARQSNGACAFAHEPAGAVASDVGFCRRQREAAKGTGPNFAGAQIHGNDATDTFVITAGELAGRQHRVRRRTSSWLAPNHRAGELPVHFADPVEIAGDGPGERGLIAAPAQLEPVSPGHALQHGEPMFEIGPPLAEVDRYLPAADTHRQLAGNLPDDQRAARRPLAGLPIMRGECPVAGERPGVGIYRNSAGDDRSRTS